MHEIGLLDVSGQEVFETVPDDGQGGSRSAGLVHHAFYCTNVLVALLIGQVTPIMIYGSAFAIHVCVWLWRAAWQRVLGLVRIMQMEGSEIWRWEICGPTYHSFRTYG